MPVVSLLASCEQPHLAPCGASQKATLTAHWWRGLFAFRECTVKGGHARQVRHNLTRTTGWEAVMRIRCSKGLRISAFHGHFFIRSTDLLALPQARSLPRKGFERVSWHKHI